LAVRLRRLPGDPRRMHGAALICIELSRSVSAGIATNHSNRTSRLTAFFMKRPGPHGPVGKRKRLVPTRGSCPQSTD
jgi:hypothetical protein